VFRPPGLGRPSASTNPLDEVRVRARERTQRDDLRKHLAPDVSAGVGARLRRTPAPRSASSTVNAKTPFRDERDRRTSLRDARDSKKSYGKDSKTYSKKRCVQRCVRARACVRRRRRRASMRSTSLNRMRSTRSTSRSRRRRACDSPRARAGGERRVNARITLRASARRARVARHPMDQSTRCRDADKNAKKRSTDELKYATDGKT